MDLVLEDVVVDSSHLIGQPGQGFAIAMEALDGGRVALLHRSVADTADGLGADAKAYRRLFGPDGASLD